MLTYDVNNAIFDRLDLHNPETEKAVRELVARALRQATAETRRAVQAALPNDPRQAYRAVRNLVYRRVLGGNVSILNPRRGGGRTRSRRTEQVDGYFGADRAFILRFVNSGTRQRTTRYGNRGSITARNFFAPAAEPAIRRAAEIIEQETQKILKL